MVDLLASQTAKIKGQMLKIIFEYNQLIDTKNSLLA